MFEMVIEGNFIQSDFVEAGVQQRSLMLPMFFTKHTAGHTNWGEERATGESLSFVADLGCVATKKNVTQGVKGLEACAADSIEWASRSDLQFDTVKTEVALFTRNGGHENHFQSNLTATIKVGNGFVRFNKEARWWLGARMESHPTFKEHCNRCMRKTNATEIRLCTQENVRHRPRADMSRPNRLPVSCCTVWK